MKLVVSIGKTYQEDPYEPIRIELGLERELKAGVKDEEITKKFKEDSLLLQDAIDEIYLDRRKFIEGES